MSFPKNSAFGQQQELEEEHRRMRMGALPAVPAESQDRIVQAHENVQIPQGVLEDWVASLELAENDGDVRDITIQMRSYFRG